MLSIVDVVGADCCVGNGEWSCLGNVRIPGVEIRTRGDSGSSCVVGRGDGGRRRLRAASMESELPRMRLRVRLRLVWGLVVEEMGIVDGMAGVADFDVVDDVDAEVARFDLDVVDVVLADVCVLDENIFV